MAIDEKLARRIYETAHLSGSFTLRSGVVSDEYFDKYRFEADPTLLGDIADAIVPLIPDDTELLGGLELGGIPLVTMLSQRTGIPARFVRKQPKEYGTRKATEGGDVDGLRVTIVEDVVTSGGAILDGARELRSNGAKLAVVVCVIDREASGRDNLAADDLELRAAVTMTELRAAAQVS